MVLLTIVAVLAFAVPFIAVAAIAAILTGARLGVRAASRGIRRLGRGPRTPGRHAGAGQRAHRGSLHRALGDAATG
jgi:hypothetical protein